MSPRTLMDSLEASARKAELRVESLVCICSGGGISSSTPLLFFFNGEKFKEEHTSEYLDSSSKLTVRAYIHVNSLSLLIEIMRELNLEAASLQALSL